jgi:4-amino-4-deoxy-L-arabinose transferase-like glycosyltransferase
MNLFKSVKKNDWLVIAGIFLYSLFFLYLRFASGNEYLLPDEAEQFLRSEYYSWVYPKNPPLYTFLLRTVILLFGKSLYIFAIFKYFIVFIFLTSFYFICRFFWNFENALVVFLSLFIFPIYSNQFNNDWAHNILVTAIASITYLVYFRMLQSESPNTSYADSPFLKNILYLSFGLIIGLGFLSKYNFLFLFLGLFFTSLFTKKARKILFNKKIWLSIFSSSILLIPHGYYLLRSRLETINYAFERAIDSSFNLLASLGDLSSSLISGSLVFFLVCLGFFLIPFKSLRTYKAFLETDSIFREERILISLFSFLSVLFTMIIFQLNYFEGKWLAPVYFTIILAIFSLVDLDKFSVRKKTIFMSVSVMMIVLVIDLKILTKFNPKNILGKVQMEHGNRRAFFQEIDKKIQAQGLAYEDSFLIYKGSEKFQADLRYFLAQARLIKEKDYKKNPSNFQKTFFVSEEELKAYL